MILLSDRVLIKEQKTENKTESGIILQNNELNKVYEVMCVGIRCKGLRVGDKIRLFEHVDMIPFEDCYFIHQKMDIKTYL